MTPSRPSSPSVEHTPERTFQWTFVHRAGRYVDVVKLKYNILAASFPKDELEKKMKLHRLAWNNSLLKWRDDVHMTYVVNIQKKKHEKVLVFFS